MDVTKKKKATKSKVEPKSSIKSLEKKLVSMKEVTETDSGHLLPEIALSTRAKKKELTKIAVSSNLPEKVIIDSGSIVSTTQPEKRSSVPKILLIEDDEMLREMYETKFKSEGYNIITADNGADGLKLALSNEYKLVLLDVILPQLDGFSVLEEMKANKLTTPVVLLTNLGTDFDRTKGEKMGAANYLVKANMTPDQIVTIVKKYLV